MLTLYSKPNCMQCKFTKEYLLDHNIEYKEINVMEDLEKLEYIRDTLGFQSLPVIETDTGDSWFGFRPDLLEGLDGE